jgi:hypothetical protein
VLGTEQVVIPLVTCLNIAPSAAVLNEDGAVTVSAWQEKQMSHMPCFVNRASLSNLVNKPNLVHNLFLVYLSMYTCYGDYGPIIRRNNCVFATLLWMTVWYAGWPHWIPDSHPHRITSARCRKNTAVSPDDGPKIATHAARHSVHTPQTETHAATTLQNL